MKLRFLIIGLLHLFLLGSLNASLARDLDTAGDAGYPGAFLYNLGTAKSLSVGHAWTVLGKDTGSVFFNPSTLVGLKGSSAALSFETASLGRLAGTAVFALHCDGESDLLTHEVSSGRSTVWAISGAWASTRDILGYDDISGTPGPSLDNSSILGQISFASSFTSNSDDGGWGLGLRGFNETFDGLSGQGLALSAGADFNVVLGILRCGFSVNNLGFFKAEDRELAWLKPLFSAGFLLRLPGLPTPLVLQFDKVLGTDQAVQVKIATEFRIFSLETDSYLNQAIADVNALSFEEELPTELFIRMGLAGGDLYGGLSFRFKIIELAYGAGIDPLDSRVRHSISLEMHF